MKIFQISDLLATTTAGTPNDPRGIGARRVDALVDIAEHLLTHGHLDLTDYLGRNPTSANSTSATSEPDRDGGSSSSSSSSSEPDRDHGTGSEPDHDHGSGSGSGSEPDADPPPGHPMTTTGTPGTPNRRRVLTRQGRRPHLSVTIALSTLTGQDDLPGRLQGFGAIPAGLARAIAASAATITALLTDPAGTVTTAGALTYRPHQDLRDTTAALHPTCRFPSCRQPAWRCDIDHEKPFDHHHPNRGGTTTTDNTGPLCRRHHLYKHHSEWRIHHDPTQIGVHWSSPTGHKYTTNGRQIAAPDLWIHHRATTTAEHLDTITASPTPPDPTNEPETPNSSSSVIEELLTAALLRHHLNTPPIEYDTDPTSSPAASAGQTQHDDQPYDPQDEPPPF